MEGSKLHRLEDFTDLSKRGEHIEASVSLLKKIVTPAVHPDEAEGVKESGDMYLLVGEYDFTAAGQMKKVSKCYAFGTFRQSEDSMAQNLRFANERLKMDYERLRQAGIIFEEKYFR